MANETTEKIIFELIVNDGGSAGSGKKVKEATDEVKNLAGSILQLQQENKKLRDERNRVNTQTEEGTRKIKDLNAMIERNNDIIKENSTALERQRLNVGNYKRGVTDALKELNIAGVNVGEVVDKVSKANEDLFQGIIKGYKDSALGAKLFGNTARTALTLTGIGIFIAALATIITHWDDIKKAIGFADEQQQSFFKTQQENIDASREKLEQYTKELEVQNELLRLQGGKENDIYNNRRTAILADLDLKKAQKENLESQINLLLKAAEIESGRKDLSSITKEEFKEIGLILEENGGTAEDNIKRLRDAYDDVSKSVVNTQNELIVLSAQQAKEVEDREKKTAEDKQKREDKAVEDYIESIKAKHKTEQEAEAEHQAVMAELRGIDGNDPNDNIDKEFKEGLEKTQEQLEAEIGLKKKYQDIDLANTVNTEKAKQLALDSTLVATQDVLGQLLGLAKDGSEEQKVLALLSIGADTAEAISALTKNSEKNPANATTGGLAGTLQFATGILRIAANIAMAKSYLGFAEGGLVDNVTGFFKGGYVKSKNYFNDVLGFANGGLTLSQNAFKLIPDAPGFAGGGLSGTRIQKYHGFPATRRNGDNLLATVKTGEVILNEKQQAALGGDATFRAIGVPGFAMGGITPPASFNYAANIETQRAAQASENKREIENIIKATLQSVPPGVITVEDFNAVADKVHGIQKRATVL